MNDSNQNQMKYGDEGIVESDAISIKNYARQLTMRYLFAITMVALIIVTGYIYIKFRLIQNERQSEIINISGRQRMLSQRIAFYTNTIGTSAHKKDVSAEVSNY